MYCGQIRGMTACTLMSCQVSVTVDAPLEKCFEVWADRINYCQWFPLIQEVRPLMWNHRSAMLVMLDNTKLSDAIQL